MFRSKSFRNAVLTATIAVLAAGGVWANESAKKRQTAGMMSAIPAQSLFCVRINKFDATLDAANEFLKDVAPASVDAKTAVFSKLGSILGDDKLSGINKKGNIAIFAVNVPGDSAARGPMGNIFIGALLPVTKYENFISNNPNCGEPDDDGISTITVNGNSMGLAANFRRFALLCPPNARENLIKVREMLARRKESLGNSLGSDERKESSSSPVWVYVNVKQASQMIQPMVMGGLQQMKAQLEKAKEKGEGPPIDPAGIIGFYSGILKTMLNGTENITIALTPSAEACKVSMGLKPVPGSPMAAMVGEPLDGDFKHMLGYLEDGAIFNLAAKIDRESLKTTYMGLFELMGEMIPGGIPEADLKQLKELLTKGIDAMGDSLAITFGGTEGSPPFAGKYVIEVRDQAAFQEVLEKELQLMEEGVFADLYKGFGMKMDVEIDRDTGSYKGVKIGAAKVAFKAGDGDDMQSKMFEKMFGDGLKYCWAFEKGNCLYAVGGEADKTIHELIDQVRAGGPGKISTEMKTAMDAMPDSRQVDALGTLNYARVFEMAFGFMPLPEGVDMSKFKIESKSNIAFAGRTTAEGKMVVDIVMPKKHLQEIQSVFKTMIPEIEKQQREMREKKSSGQS